MAWKNIANLHRIPNTLKGDAVIEVWRIIEQNSKSLSRMDRIFREAIADLQVITAGTTLTQHYLTVLTAVAQLAQGLCMANLSLKLNLHLHYLQQTKLGVDCGAKKLYQSGKLVGSA